MEGREAEHSLKEQNVQEGMIKGQGQVPGKETAVAVTGEGTPLSPNILGQTFS